MNILQSILDKLSKITQLRDRLRTKLSSMYIVPDGASLETCVESVENIAYYDDGFGYTLDTVYEVHSIPEGYHNGGEYVCIGSTAVVDVSPSNIKTGKKILGVSGTFTADATATSSDILNGKIAYSKGEKLIGTYIPTAPDPDGEVRFYDYDGSLLYSYSLVDIKAQTKLPELPYHYGLTCQGWNWTLDELSMLEYGVNVGAMYTTSNEDTRLYIEIPNTTLLTITLCFNQSVSEGVTVDWGDGSGTEKVSGTGNMTMTHTYPRALNYIISLMPSATCNLKLGHTLAGYNVLGEVNNNTRAISNILKGVNIGKRVAAISSYAFQYCRSLEYITLPQTVTSMGNYSFNNASSLKCVIIGNNATSIPTYTFGSCYALKTVSLPYKLTSIAASAFRYCYSLESITIPPQLTILNGYSFSDCYSLKRVTLPNTVTSFGNFAFYKCHALTEFKFPYYLTTVGNSSFYQNYSLAKIDIPDLTTTINTYAFYDCHALTEIDIPASVTEIKAFAFQNCYSMKRIWVRAETPPTLGASAFLDIPDDCVIYVPDGKVLMYLSASGWSEYSAHIQGTEFFPAI